MKGGDAMARRRQREFSAERKVEQFRFAICLKHQRAEARAGERVASRAQRVFHMRCTKKKDARRIGPQLEETGAENLSRFERGKILPDPEQRFLAGSLQSQSERKSCGRRFMAWNRDKNLMQRPYGKTAVQCRIGRPMTQGHAPPCSLRRQQGGPQISDFSGSSSHICSYFVLKCFWGNQESI